MKRIVIAACILGLGTLAASIPAWAHHSFSAAYNMQSPVEVTGVIVKVRLENPHSWFFLNVKGADGKMAEWAFEAGTPSGMLRNGYKPNEIKAGVTVTIKGFHARDMAQNRGMLRELITADGKTYGMFGPQQSK